MNLIQTPREIVSETAQLLRGGFMANFQAPREGALVLGGAASAAFTWLLHLPPYMALLGLAVGAMLVDFLAGTFYAILRRDDDGKRVWSAPRLYDGAFRKLGRFMLVPLAFLVDATLLLVSRMAGAEMLTDLVSTVLPMAAVACLWIIAGEAGSTIKTLTTYGGPGAVPGLILRAVDRLRGMLNGRVTKETEGP